MKVSVIIPVKNRLEHLKQCLPLVMAQTHKDIEVIIVDYNCPQKSGVWVWENFNMVNVAMCDVGAEEWSLSAARNEGFKQSIGDVILFLDADALLINPTFIEAHLNHLIDGSFICGWGWSEATGCMMIQRSAFLASNGYNEALKSWGYEDIDMYERLQHNLHIEKRVWLGGIETIKHGDEFRNLYHGGKAPMQTNEENYQIAKTQFKGL